MSTKAAKVVNKKDVTKKRSSVIAGKSMASLVKFRSTPLVQYNLFLPGTMSTTGFYHTL